VGTTLEAFKAGNVRYVWSVAIEGYSKILTNGSTSAMVTAYAGTDWSSAQGGLFVDVTIDQKLDPKNPIGSMGTCVLSVIKDGTDDTFGIATHRRAGGVETYLEESLDRNDTTVTVRSTSQFASSGEVHIGTECIAYTGTTANTLTTCTRGKYSPFTTEDEGRFSRDHRVRFDANNIHLQPIVSSLPRTWRGRFVAVRAHRDVGGVYDTLAESELVFAGTIDTIRDSRDGATVVALKSIMDWVGDRVLGEDAWEATIDDGIYLNAGLSFDFFDWYDTTDATGANRLTVVSGTPSGVNQMAAGLYSAGEICSRVNAWLAAERTANRLLGSHYIESPVAVDVGYRTKVHWSLPSGSTGGFMFQMPILVAKFFGFTEKLVPPDAVADQNLHTVLKTGADDAVSGTYWDANTGPQRIYVRLTRDDYSVLSATTVGGEFVDQLGHLPPSMTVGLDDAYEWGLFAIDNKMLVIGTKVGSELTQLRHWSSKGEETIFDYWVPAEASPPRIRQILAIEDEFATLMVMLMGSTGTAGFNQTLLDQYTRTLSMGVPFSLLGDDFIAEVPSGNLAVLLAKATKFRDLIASDLFIRWAYMKWQNGGIRFGVWKSPSSGDAVYELDETTKAEPSGHQASQRASSEQITEWLTPVIKFEYDHVTVSLGSSDEYRSSMTFADRVAIDDQGEAVGAYTVEMRNTFSDFTATGQSMDSLLPHFMANAPLISRPGWIIERSIDPRYFWRIGIGDTVLLSDRFARDPQTGTRGIVERPALVVGHTFRPGGLTKPGMKDPEPMGGRVRLYFSDADTERVDATYAPAGEINDAVTVEFAGYDHGYNEGTPSIVLKEHAYSEFWEPFDVTHFEVGDLIRVIERDPISYTSPLYWDREVIAISEGDSELTLDSPLDGFDTARVYRVMSQPYSEATASQHLHVYQADDGDGLIQDEAQPFLYNGTIGSNSSLIAAETHTNLPEMVPSSTYTDGAPLDVGHVRAMIRAANNLLDYKTAIKAPKMFTSEISNTDVTGTSYKLVDYWPVFLGAEVPTATVVRQIATSVMARSTDGTSTKIRVTLSRNRPTASTLTDVTFAGTYSQVEWTGITSTTAAVQSTAYLPVNVKQPGVNTAWVCVELGYKCACWGVAKFEEGAR
jgi:hypothetical protein